MRDEDTVRTSFRAVPRSRTMEDLVERQSVILSRIESERQLLLKELLHYFGETCPALAKRCETAIDVLRLGRRREAANCLQKFSNEANRRLAAARFATTSEQVTVGLLDRARASIQHLEKLSASCGAPHR